MHQGLFSNAGDFDVPTNLVGNVIEIPVAIKYTGIYESPFAAVEVMEPGLVYTCTRDTCYFGLSARSRSFLFTRSTMAMPAIPAPPLASMAALLSAASFACSSISLCTAEMLSCSVVRSGAIFGSDDTSDAKSVKPTYEDFKTAAMDIASETESAMSDDELSEHHLSSSPQLPFSVQA